MADYKVVHVKTQEEWDIVTAVLGYRWECCNFGEYGSDSCINLEGNRMASLNFYRNEGSSIISFEEFCVKYGCSKSISSDDSLIKLKPKSKVKKIKVLEF